MANDQHFQFIDFESVSAEERHEIEEVLRRPSKRVEFPWDRHEDVVPPGVFVPVTSMIPCMTMPLHQAQMPMYAGPSMVSVYQYPHPHTMVYSPYMVPVTMSSNGMVPSSYIPVTMTTVPATLSSNGMLPSSYMPVTMTTGPNPNYASQPPMMPQVDGHMSQRPLGVTMNCCPPAMVAPRVMQQQAMPVAAVMAGQPVGPQPPAPAVGNLEAGNPAAEMERRNRKIRPANYYQNQVDNPCKDDEEMKQLGDGVAKLSLRKDSVETGYHVSCNQSAVQDIGQQGGDAVICQSNIEAVQLQIENAVSQAFPGGEVMQSNHVAPADVKASSENSQVSTPVVGSRKSSVASDVPARAAASRTSSTASDVQAPIAGNGGSSNASTRRSSVASETSMPVSANGSQSGMISAACASGSGSTVVSKPKSWASLLHNTATATNAIVVNASDQTQQLQNAKKTAEQRTPTAVKDKPARSVDAKNMAPLDEVKAELMILLKNHRPSHRSIYLQPRGLANRSNWCYVNATLQALLACPPFYHLIRILSTINPKFWEVSNFPAMKSMVKFFNEFPVVTVKALDKQAVNAKGNVKADIRCGAPFEPVYVHKMLQDIDYEAFKMNQQEDAEEFLSCILNRLHDEMVNAMKQLEGVEGKKAPGEIASLTNGTQESKTDDGDDDTRWEQVRARNRTVYSSSGSDEASPVSSIFRGQICCILHQLGQKESATLQPFFSLQLDVQNEKVKSVQDALEQLVLKESLFGYTKSNVEVDATQRTLIEELPPVLVLHLKWFHYDKNGGIQKRIKQVDFDIDMEISKDFLSPHAKARTQQGQRKYKLFAVVNHIGARAIGGHYTVDVFHPGYNCWLRCDDNNISSIPTNLVTKFTAPKVPYLIFYRRFELS